jgi:hypothetical protein
MVPEAQHTETGTLECARPCSVGFGLQVLAAIEFDDQPLFHAHEIRDPGAQWNLPAELQSAEIAVAQMTPERSLGIRTVPAKRSRAGFSESLSQVLPSP